MGLMGDPDPKRGILQAVLSHRLGPLAAIAAANLAASFLLRLIFFARSASELDGILPIPGLFAIGLFYDLVETSYVLVVPALTLVVLPEAFFRSRVYRFITWGTAALVLFLLIFDALSQW